MSVDVVVDVAYRGTPAGDLHVDLYRPPGDGPHPAVVLLHGGAWRSGEKGQFDAQARWLARHGYAGLAANYRLSGTATYPAAVRDVRAAVRWARADPEGLGLDGRVAAVGQSAGAHLAALVALAPAEDAEEDGPDSTAPSSTPDAVVGVSGIYDLRPFADEGPYCEEFLGATRDEEPGLYREASPIAHVPRDNEGSAADSDASSQPPFLLCYATDDDLVRNGQSEAFEAALADAGVPVETFVADSGGHRFFREDEWADRTAERMGRFLDESLGEG